MEEGADPLWLSLTAQRDGPEKKDLPRGRLASRNFICNGNSYWYGNSTRNESDTMGTNSIFRLASKIRLQPYLGSGTRDVKEPSCNTHSQSRIHPRIDGQLREMKRPWITTYDSIGKKVLHIICTKRTTQSLLTSSLQTAPTY